MATLEDLLLVLSGVYRMSRPERAVLRRLVRSTVSAIIDTCRFAAIRQGIRSDQGCEQESGPA